MRTFSIVCIVLLMSVKAFAQQQQLPNDRMFYVAKMEHYRKMKNTGTTLTVLGTTLTIIGVVTLLNSSQETYNNGYNTTTSTTGNPIAGAMCYLGGIACVGTGVPLWIVGGINKGRYERKAEAVTLKLKVNQQSAGVALCYKF